MELMRNSDLKTFLTEWIIRYGEEGYKAKVVSQSGLNNGIIDHHLWAYAMDRSYIGGGRVTALGMKFLTEAPDDAVLNATALDMSCFFGTEEQRAKENDNGK